MDDNKTAQKKKVKERFDRLVEEKAGGSACKLAAMTGLTPASISQYRSAKNIPSKRISEKLGMIFRIDPDWFRGEGDDDREGYSGPDIQSKFDQLSPIFQNQIIELVDRYLEIDREIELLIEQTDSNEELDRILAYFLKLQRL